MAERLSQEQTPAIRFHHLWQWEDFVLKYSKALPDTKPWDILGEDSKKAKTVIFDFVNEYTHIEAHVREYLEILSLTEEKSALGDLAYLSDLIGSTPKEFAEVLEKRVEAFSKVFDYVSNNKNNLILLSIEPDDICHSCAVGLHCKKSLFQKIVRTDKDFVFMRVLQKLAKQRLEADINGGAIGTFGRDVMYISGETLFNPEFYKQLGSEIDKIYGKAWR